MDIDTLRIFAEVIQRGSFAKVSRDRGVAASSISRAISSLEEELGLRLFQRSTRRLSPTEAGMTYFRRIESVLEELEQAHFIAVDIEEQVKGTLRVTAPVTFAQLTLIPLLPEFLEKYSLLSLDIDLSGTILDLLENRIDIAVRVGALTDSSLIAHRLCEMKYAICASPEYIAKYSCPEKPADLKKHNCLRFPIPGHGPRWRFRSRKGNVKEVSVQGRLMISNGLALRSFALAGTGIIILPRWNVTNELKEGALVELFPDYEVTPSVFDLSVWLVYPSRSYLPLKVRVFIEFLQKKFQSISF